MYKSGDRAMWNKDAKLICFGRSDSVVKLRGQRIDLNEIEEVALECNTAKEAAAIVCTHLGYERLIVFVVPIVNPDEIKRAMSTRLPTYMVPEVLTIDAMPSTANAKVDRKSLIELAGKNLSMRAQSDFAQTKANNSAAQLSDPSVKLALDLVRSTTGINAFPTTRLADAGMNSLNVFALIRKLNTYVGDSASQLVTTNPSIEELAARINSFNQINGGSQDGTILYHYEPLATPHD